MSDHGSDSVFSDVEEAAAPRLSEKDPGSVSSHSVGNVTIASSRSNNIMG